MFFLSLWKVCVTLESSLISFTARKGNVRQTIISIISTNLGRFGANSVIKFGSWCSIWRYILQFSKNRIVFLEIRDSEDLLFSTACSNSTIYSFEAHSSDRSTVWPSGYELLGQDISIAPDRQHWEFKPRSSNFVLEILENVFQDFYGRY